MGQSVPAFESVYRDFRPRLLRYLSGLAGREAAADLAQVALMKVGANLPRFRGESSLATWIYRIATNVAWDHLRQRDPECVPVDADEDGEQAPPGELPAALQAPSAEATAMRGELDQCIREFVERLPPNYRTVLVLVEIEGFTLREAAEVTGLTLDNVKVRLHRARLRLRAEMQAGCTLERDERNELSCDRRGAHASG